MIYTNLLTFLVVIFLYSTNVPAVQPMLPIWLELLLAAALLGLFARLVNRVYARVMPGASSAYFAAEKKLTLLAIVFFAILIYGLDLKYYLHVFSLDGRLPVLENLAGLGVFFLLLSIIWLRGRRLYEAVFHRSYSAPGFIVANIRINLPIVLPWLALSLVFDLLALLPWPGLQEVLASSWGDLILFAFFIVFLALFFPPLVRWLWGCKPMPPGPLLDHIESFCRAQGFHSEILYWPLFEGQVLTAAVMGIVPRFRYLMITPGLAAALDEDELDAVLSHEIGHVKHYHLVQYVLLFLGFSLLAGKLIEPLPYLLLGSDFFYRFLQVFPVDPDTMLAVVSLVVLLGFMLLYFRFIFGYFIRNFERQADLYVFYTQGTAQPLIRAFEKIILLGGGRRDEKNWHHFGIGERINFLEQCEQNPALIRQHATKLRASLAAYFMLIGAVFLVVPGQDVASLAEGYELRYAEAVLMHRLEKEPNNSLWLRMLGDLMEKKAMEKKAIEAYEKALQLDPADADLSNNLAWLLLTAKDESLRDPIRALTLARSAVLLKEEGYILDTLAEAYFANGLYEEAIATEQRAIKKDPRHARYYRSQLKKFMRGRSQQR